MLKHKISLECDHIVYTSFFCLALYVSLSQFISSLSKVMSVCCRCVYLTLCLSVHFSAYISPCRALMGCYVCLREILETISVVPFTIFIPSGPVSLSLDICKSPLAINLVPGIFFIFYYGSYISFLHLESCMSIFHLI